MTDLPFDRHPLSDLLVDLQSPWARKPGKSGGYVRMSGSADPARKLAFELGEWPHDPQEPRSALNLEAGEWYHDHLRDTVERDLGDSYEVLDRERLVESAIPNPKTGEDIPITGHIDLRMRHRETGVTYLIDIKTVRGFAFKKHHPSGDKYAPERPYICNANKAFDKDVFNRGYLLQMASYTDALAGEFDHALFWMVNKGGHHFALGEYDTTANPEYLAERDAAVVAATNAPGPKSLPLCFDMTSKLHLRCKYCNYLNSCLVVTRDSNGKPTHFTDVR